MSAPTSWMLTSKDSLERVSSRLDGIQDNLNNMADDVDSDGEDVDGASRCKRRCVNFFLNLK